MESTRGGYRNYTADGTYWTVRKQGSTFWVVRIDNSSGYYEWTEVWGGYSVAGAAAGAAAQLAYAQGAKDALATVRTTLHEALDAVGLGMQLPPAPAVPPTQAPEGVADEADQEETR